MSTEQSGKLSREERTYLLSLARYAITTAVTGRHGTQPAIQGSHPSLELPAACFVTLNTLPDHRLRGCTGILTAQAPLAKEVNRIAVQTAFNDPRFPPVAEHELSDLEIEISVLTVPQKLVYEDPTEIPELIRPFIDGVTLSRGYNRATFLPQVWKKFHDPMMFLDMLCQKMGQPGAWRKPDIIVEVYQVEEFSENSI